MDKIDPWDTMMALGAQVSPDLDAYASGQISVAEIRCVLCRHAPCDCPEFGTPEYFALLDRVHGKSRTTAT